MVQPTPEKKKIYRKQRNMTTMDVDKDTIEKLFYLKKEKGFSSLSEVVEYLISENEDE